MKWFSQIGYLYKELRQTLKDPARRRELWQKTYRDVLRVNFRVGKVWKRGAAGTQQREYDSYRDYLDHQKIKLEYINLVERERQGLAEYHRRYREVLRERLARLPLEWPQLRVLCLAARLGTEVLAFRDLGANAVGVDLNPGEGNPYVLPADFHHLPFRDGGFGAAFCNSLDHVFDLNRFLQEIQRVLAPEGRLLLEVQQGSAEGRKPGLYESFWWNRIEDLLPPLAKAGFSPESRTAFDYPWGGELLMLRQG